MLRGASEMKTEREAFGMGFAYLTTLFPIEAQSFEFHVHNDSRTFQYKLLRSLCVSSVFTAMM